MGIFASNGGVMKYHIENDKGWKLGYLYLMKGFWTYGKPVVYETKEGAEYEIELMNKGLVDYDEPDGVKIVEIGGKL